MAGSLGWPPATGHRPPATGHRPPAAAYAATKAEPASLTQAWTAECSSRGVRFNTVAPGPVCITPEARDLSDALAETTATKRAAEPAEAVAFLASPKAATSPARPSP
ncbi:SDR family oxidoreductase [Streptomyces decoyicus]